MSQLARFVRHRRKVQGLIWAEVVKWTPFINVAKGVHRLSFLEEGVRMPDAKGLGRFGAALSISFETVR